MELKVDYELDTQGLRCPEPLMMLRNKVRSMTSGEIIRIVATDPSTAWDFENFCRFMNHEMVVMETESLPYQYWIKKG